jgi:uncharacterized membrane protein YkoI
MELSEALERAEQDDHVQKLKSFFLGSAFASINADEDKSRKIREWTLLYYNPAKNSIIDCSVSDKFVTVGEEMPAIKEVAELDVSRVKVPLHQAFAAADSCMKKKALNILISLHTKEISGKSYTAWTIAFVTADMSVTSVDVDASTGKILKEETTRLVRRL